MVAVFEVKKEIPADMKTSRVCFPKTAAVLTLWLIFTGVATRTAPAQTFTTLYSFTGGSDGAYPYAGVIQDPAGTLYGTTYIGGEGDGVVYRAEHRRN